MSDSKEEEKKVDAINEPQAPQHKEEQKEESSDMEWAIRKEGFVALKLWEEDRK